MSVSKKFIFIISTAVLMASCSSMATSGTAAGKAQPSIAESSWTLTEQVKGNTPTLKVEAGRLTGNAGCNTYFGNLTLNTSTGDFKAGELASTKKMCENMSIEKNFLKMLSEANRYAVNGNTLELYKDNLLLMKFNKN
ncbi:MAG: META domain-containing protein [Bergeyella sp.]